TIAHPLGRGHNVGLDAVMLNAEPFIAGSAPGSLDFVRDEKPAVVFGDLVNTLEVIFWRNNKSAYAEDSLSHKSRDLAGCGRLDQFFDVVGTGKPAILGGCIERAAIAIRRMSVDKTRDLRGCRFPCRVSDR